MITVTTKVHVDDLSAKEITDFFLRADDVEYRRWWPGTHLQYHLVRRVPGDVGSVFFFDEYVGDRRVRMKGVLREAIPGKRLVMQMKKGLQLPVWLTMDLQDTDGGVDVTHAIRAGYEGAGQVLDPLFRLYLSPSFCTALDEHATTEFNRLGPMLHSAPG